MSRRWLVRVMSGVGASLLISSGWAEPVSIAVMNCTLIDDNAAYNDADTNRLQHARIGMISDALRAQLEASGRYRVADASRAADLIAKLEAEQDLTTCDGAGCRKSAT